MNRPKEFQKYIGFNYNGFIGTLLEELIIFNNKKKEISSLKFQKYKNYKKFEKILLQNIETIEYLLNKLFKLDKKSIEILKEINNLDVDDILYDVKTISLYEKLGDYFKSKGLEVILYILRIKERLIDLDIVYENVKSNKNYNIYSTIDVDYEYIDDYNELLIAVNLELDNGFEDREGYNSPDNYDDFVLEYKLDRVISEQDNKFFFIPLINYLVF